MPFHRMYCPKCKREEVAVHVEWEDKKDCLSPYFCQECGGPMHPIYTKFNFSIKGPSPSKDSKAKAIYNEQMNIYNEGFRDSGEVKAAVELGKEREKERKKALGIEDYLPTKKKPESLKERLKYKAQEQREMVKKGTKKARID